MIARQRTVGPQRFRQSIPPLPAGLPGAAFLDVVFNVTRGVPAVSDDEQAQLPTFLQWDSVVQQEVPPNVLRFTLRPGEADAARPIEVEGSGEPLELVKVVLRDDGARPIAVLAPDPRCPGQGPLKRLRDIDDVIGNSFGAKEYLLALSEAAATHAFRDSFELFCRFDLHTNPVIWENLRCQGEDPLKWLDPALVSDPCCVASAVEAIKGALVNRLVYRMERYPNVPAFLPFDPNESDAQHARTLSALQLQLYSRYSPSTIARAFELFASGQLRTPLKNLAIACQPSSGYYFLFGEFALLAVDNGLCPAEWTALARVLLRTQPVFAKTYAPRASPAKPCFGSYSSGNYCGRKVTPQELAALERQYATAVDLAAKAGRNARNHLGGI